MLIIAMENTMPINETAPARRDDQMHQLQQAQRLALILGGHNCRVYERAIGNLNNARFCCQVCNTERRIDIESSFVGWLQWSIHNSAVPNPLEAT